MIKKRALLAVMVGLLILPAASAGCGYGESDKPVIKVAFDRDWGSDMFWNGTGYDGIGPRVMQIAADWYGWKVVQVYVPDWNETVRMVINKELDATFLYDTKSRRDSGIVYSVCAIKDTVAYYALTEKSVRINSVQDVAKYTVAVKSGESYGVPADETLKAAKVRKVNGFPEQIAMVLSGEADIAPYLESAGNAYLKAKNITNVSICFETEDQAIHFGASNGSFVAVHMDDINETINYLNATGELETILRESDKAYEEFYKKNMV